MREPKRKKKGTTPNSNPPRRPMMDAMMDEREHRRRAIAHLKSALRYERRGLPAKARAHFGRAMHYGSGFDLGKLPRDIIEMIVVRVINDGEGDRLIDIQTFMKAVTVEVSMSEFLHMSVDHMRRSPFYQLYITVVHAMARKSTLEMVEFLSKYEKSVTGGDTSRNMESAIKHLRIIIMLEWFHMCPYRFHDLVAILHSEGTPDAINAICLRLLETFISHLDSAEECSECKVLKRDETKMQIREIINGTFKPDAIDVDHDGKVVDGFVEKYESDLATKQAKYGGLCVWKTGGVKDMSSVFQERLWNAEEWDVRLWDTRSLLSMNHAFGTCIGLLTGVEHWSVGTVVSMASMFSDTPGFNRDIGNWDTRKVTNMSWMFYGAVSFNRDIGNWDTRQVTDMSLMFNDASSFNQSIGKWDTRQVKNMRSMFSGASSFSQDIGNWDTRSVEDTSAMFSRAKLFNQNIGKWDTRKVTNMNSMFNRAISFNQSIGKWDTSRVTNMSWMFSTASSFNQDIGGWITSEVRDMRGMFGEAHVFDQSLSRWDVGKVDMGNMLAMFRDARAMKDDHKPPGARNGA